MGKSQDLLSKIEFEIPVNPVFDRGIIDEAVVQSRTTAFNDIVNEEISKGRKQKNNLKILLTKENQFNNSYYKSSVVLAAFILSIVVYLKTPIVYAVFFPFLFLPLCLISKSLLMSFSL